MLHFWYQSRHSGTNLAKLLQTDWCLERVLWLSISPRVFGETSTNTPAWLDCLSNGVRFGAFQLRAFYLVRTWLSYNKPLVPKAGLVYVGQSISRRKVGETPMIDTYLANRFD